MTFVQASLDAYLARPSNVERELRRLLLRRHPLVICDIGACEGEDTVRYARLYPAAKIFAFEPLPANQALARANFSRYSVPNAELVPLALSNRAGESTLHVSSGRPPELYSGEDWNYGNKSSSLLAPAQFGPMHGWIEFKEAITVPTTTLDAFCQSRSIDRIDFIHMDVQGAEMLVLQGATQILPRVTAIWLEVARRELYHGQALDRDLSRWMRRHGFALAHEVYLGGETCEGDHLYVNLRQPCGWPYVASQLLRSGWRRTRRAAGRVKHALFPALHP